MKYSDELNMAIAAVSMDRMLDMKTKQQIIEALAETEMLADIGEATEKAFESGATIEGYNVECYTLEQLLEWSESEVSE